MDDLKIETRQWQGTSVTRRTSDGFVNATAMCSATGKDWFNYKSNCKTMAYLTALSDALKVDQTSLVVSIPRFGTWVHPRLAMDLARWCSPDFAVWIDGWLIPPASVVYAVEDRLYQDQFVVRTELQLHEKVVQFIRKRYPEVILAPGLGETGATSEARLANWRKGYQAGCPDVLVIHRHPKYTGLALEFKHPGGLGVTSDRQTEFLAAIQSQGWLVVLSQSYDDIIIAITDYMREANIVCPECRTCFTTLTGLGNHVRTKHSKKRGRDPQEDSTVSA
jgi:hypothetical protein